MADHSSLLRTIMNRDGAAVLDTRLGFITTLNLTGAYVWQGLERGESVETIVANLSRETGEQTEVIQQDVTAFIGALRAKHLLSSDGPEGPQ